MSIRDFASKLVSDENAVSKDERKLGRDEGREQSFAAKLGVASYDPALPPPMPPGEGLGRAAAFSSRLGVLDPASGALALNGSPQVVDSSGPVTKYEDGSAAQMYAAAGIQPRSMSDAGGMFAPPEQGSRKLFNPTVPGGGTAYDENNRPVVPSQPVAPIGPPAPPGDAPLSTGNAMQNPMAPMSPGPQTVPAHWDNSRIPDRPGTRNALVRDIQDAGSAQQEEMRAVRNQNMIVANNLQRQADDAQDMLVHRQVMQEHRDAYVAEKRNQLDNRLNDVATSREDPNRLYKNADTGTKIALGIGAFFGSLIPGVKPLMAMLGGSIDNDVQAQRQDQKSKMWGVEMARHDLNDARGDVHEQRQNDLADEASKWGAAEAQIKAQMARTNDPILKAKGQEALVATQAQITGLRQQYDRISHVNSYSVGGGGGAPKTPQMLIRMPDGSTRVAPTKESYEGATKAIGFTQNIRSNIEKALAIRKNASSYELANPVSSVSKRLVSLQKDTEQLVTVRRGQGAMSKGDEEVAQGALGQFDSFWNGSANEDVMRGASERESQHLEGDVNALGAERVDPGYRLDANGRVVPDAEYRGESDKPRPNMPKSREVK